MTANSFIGYWQHFPEWYVFDTEKNEYSLKDNAPEEIKKSFSEYQKFYQKCRKRAATYLESN